MPLARKLRLAHVAVFNDGTEADLRADLARRVLPRLRARLWLWWVASLPGLLAVAAAARRLAA